VSRTRAPGRIYESHGHSHRLICGPPSRAIGKEVHSRPKSGRHGARRSTIVTAEAVTSTSRGVDHVVASTPFADVDQTGAVRSGALISVGEINPRVAGPCSNSAHVEPGTNRRAEHEAKLAADQLNVERDGPGRGGGSSPRTGGGPSNENEKPSSACKTPGGWPSRTRGGSDLHPTSPRRRALPVLHPPGSGWVVGGPVLI